MKKPNWFARTAKAAILALSAAVTGAAWADSESMPKASVVVKDARGLAEMMAGGGEVTEEAVAAVSKLMSNIGAPVSTFSISIRATKDESGTVSLNTPSYTTSTDSAFVFTPVEDQTDEYGSWRCDFVVSFDEDVKADSVILAGYYNNMLVPILLGFDFEGNNVTKQFLLDSTPFQFDYNAIVHTVGAFVCTAINIAPENVGKTINVSLVMWNDSDSTYTKSNPYVVTTIPYKFTKENLSTIKLDMSEPMGVVPFHLVSSGKNDALGFAFNGSTLEPREAAPHFVPAYTTTIEEPKQDGTVTAAVQIETQNQGETEESSVKTVATAVVSVDPVSTKSESAEKAIDVTTMVNVESVVRSAAAAGELEIKAEANTIVIKVQSNRETSASTENKLVYDVTPVAIVNGNTGTPVTLTNDDLADGAEFTFHLDVTSLSGVAEGGTVAATHKSSDGSTVYGTALYTAKAGDNNTLYVEITTDKFSTWDLSAVDTDGKVAVVVSSTGVVAYAELQDAFNAAFDGDTVQLLADTAAASIPAGKNITLDLNGKTITGQIYVNANATLVVNATNGGVIDNSAKAESYVAYAINAAGNLTINGGTFKGGANAAAVSVGGDSSTVTVNDGTFSGLYGLYVGEKVSSVRINDGTFTGKAAVEVATPSGATADGGVQIDIYGGSFTRTDSSYEVIGFNLNSSSSMLGTPKVTLYGGTYNKFQKRSSLATGYQQLNNGNGTWTVKESLTEAEKALAVAKVGDYYFFSSSDANEVGGLKSGETIELTRDSSDFALTLPDGATLEGNGYTLTGVTYVSVPSPRTGTIKNVKFKEATGTTNHAIIGAGGTLVVTGCEFDSCRPDNNTIEYNGTGDGSVTITGNVFTHSNPDKTPERYINVYGRKGADVNFTATIKDNIIENANEGGTTIVPIRLKYFGATETLDIGGNYIEDPTAIAINESTALSAFNFTVYESLDSDGKIDANSSVMYKASGEADPKQISKVFYVAQIGNTGYTTLAAALKAANSGDTIEILDGTWGADAIAYDSLTLDEKLAIRTKSLTVQAAEGATPKFVADVFLGYDDSKTVNASMTVKGLAFENAQLKIGEYVQVTVENCSFTGSGADAALAIIDSCVKTHLTADGYPAAQVTVKNCTFDGTETSSPAIRVRNGGNVTITGNTIANSNHNGITVESNNSADNTPVKTVLIQDNTIAEWNVENVSGDVKNRGGRAIRLALGTLAEGSTVTIEGNTFRKKNLGLGLDEPDFVKITGAGSAAVDISGNDWNDMLLSEVSGNSAIYSCDSASAPMIGSVITTRKEPVAQIGTTKYTSLAAAVEAVPTDGTETTIQMIADETIDGTTGVTIGTAQDIVLDLNGHTVQMAVASADERWLIKNEGSMTVKDSAENGKLFMNATGQNSTTGIRKSVVKNMGSFTVEGGTIEMAYSGTKKEEPTAVMNDASERATSFTVNGGTVVNSANRGTGVFLAVNDTFATTFDMQNGRVEGYGAAVRYYFDDNALTDAKLAFKTSGGTIYGRGMYGVQGMTTSSKDWTGISFAISGGTFDSVGLLNRKHVIAPMQGTVSVSGGTFNGDVYIYGHSLNITDGDFNGAVTLHRVKESLVSASISGGRFKGAFAIAETTNENTVNPYYNSKLISGGIFSVEPSATYIATGYESADNTDAETKVAYPYTVNKYVAQNVQTDEKYSTLAAALDAAQDGQTVKLLVDAAQNDGIIFNKAGAGVILDLDGKTFTVNTGANCNNRAFRIDNGTLTVKNGSIVAAGSGTTSSNGAGCYGAFRVEKDGTLNVQDATLSNSRPWGLNVKILGGRANLERVTINSSYGGGIEVTEADLGASSQPGYAELTDCTFTQTGYFDHCSTALSVSGGSELVVNSGTYTSENYGIYVFSSGGKIVVKDGTFEGAGKAVVKAEMDTNTYPAYTGAVQISGGKFKGALSVISPASMSISGGVFTAPVVAQYCASGYEPADNTDDATKDNYPYTVGKQLAVVDAATGTAEMSKALDGYTFKMAVSQNGGVAAVSEVSEPVIPAEDLPASGKYATYAFTAVKTADGSETPVQNTVGILRVDDNKVKSETTVIAVPWQAFGDKIAIGSLVYLGNRSDGDQLMAYAANGTYYSWTLKVEGSTKTWTPDKTVKTGSEEAVEAPAASEFPISRGQGVFLKRINVKEPIYLVGRAPASSETAAATTTLAAGSASKPAWSLVAAPSKTALDLNASGSPFGSANASDTIMLVSAGGVAMKIPYTYKDGKWGRPVSRTVTETRANGKTVTYTYTERSTEGCTIPAGTGFWYLNKGGEKTVQW